MILHPYFVFNGQAREALLFYCQALDISHGEIKAYGDSPMPHTPEQKNWVVHAELQFDGETIAMFADSAEAPLAKNSNIHISLNYDDLALMEKSFAQLAEGGKIDMPLEMQFWNATFGTLTDKFGIHWMMNFDHTS